MSGPILSDVADGIARITLNNPERLNAFNDEMAVAWEQVTTEIVARDDVRVVLLSGAGRAFCAGGDVQLMANEGFAGKDLAELARVINRGQLALLESPIPVVAAAHGTTAGGGLGVLLNSDYAIVGESSRIGALYAKIGLTPDMTVSALLARAVGERRALQLVLQDRLLTASEAHEWGLVAEVVPDDRVHDRAEELAQFLAENTGWARGQAKRIVRAAYERPLRESLEDEAVTIGIALDSSEAQARVAEFAKK